MEGEGRCMCISSPLQKSLPFERKNANYRPSLWDDSYIQSLPDSALAAAQVEQWEKLKEEIRHLIKSIDDVEELLCLFDTLRQLGVSYHFEREIKSSLSFIVSSLDSSLCNALKNNPFASALLFRLLRENCIDDQNQSKNIMLGSIKNENGSFNMDILTDAKGMLCLYEASYLAIEGESELEEVGKFTAKHLSDYVNKSLHANGNVSVNPLFAEKINYALETPLHWRVNRLHSVWFINFYERLENMNPDLLRFAKLDFNLLQTVYKKELKELSKWWESAALIGDEFSFARNRLVENYFTCVECLFEPHFWKCRIELCKLCCLVTTYDDIYDIYGSLEELEVFTKAIEEWRVTDEAQLLPDCLKKSLVVLFNTVSDIALNYSSYKGLDIFPHLKQTWRDLSKSYMVETKWVNERVTPSFNDYLKNAWITVTAPLLGISSYLLSEDLTKEALNQLDFSSDILHFSCIVTRLHNDWGTSSNECKRDDVPKSIQCYMKEKNVSESVARCYIKELIEKYWRKLNGEYISRSNLEESYKSFLLNLPRLTHFMYNNGDWFGVNPSESRDRIKTLIVEPIPL